MQVTTKQFARMHDVDYIQASNFIKFLHLKGVVKEVRRDRPKGGRGRPTIVYDVPDTINLKLS